MPLILVALRRQRQMDLCEFKASVVYPNNDTTPPRTPTRPPRGGRDKQRKKKERMKVNLDIIKSAYKSKKNKNKK